MEEYFGLGVQREKIYNSKGSMVAGTRANKLAGHTLSHRKARDHNFNCRPKPRM